MPKINQPGDGHTGPTVPGGHQYLNYTNAAYIKTLEEAMQIVSAKIKDHKPCNDAFKALPGGKTLKSLWADNTIWLNYDPSRTVKDFGATSGKDVTITAYSLNRGKWTVAATLVHEMAHVNGASGATADAENTLLKCLLKDHHDPAIIGELLNPNAATGIA